MMVLDEYNMAKVNSNVDDVNWYHSSTFIVNFTPWTQKKSHVHKKFRRRPESCLNVSLNLRPVSRV